MGKKKKSRKKSSSSSSSPSSSEDDEDIADEESKDKLSLSREHELQLQMARDKKKDMKETISPKNNTNERKLERKKLLLEERLGEKVVSDENCDRNMHDNRIKKEKSEEVIVESRSVSFRDSKESKRPPSRLSS